MGYGISFLSRTQLTKIIEQTNDPAVKALAEATLNVYALHLHLEKSLVEAIANAKDKK